MSSMPCHRLREGPLSVTPAVVSTATCKMWQRGGFAGRTVPFFSSLHLMEGMMVDAVATKLYQEDK